MKKENLVALLFAAILCSVFWSWSSYAQETYPTRPITLVVPFPPGGPTDVLARVLAERMRPVLGQPVIIENISGAGGGIAVGRVARALGDGYTLVIGQISTHVLNGATYDLPYDLQRDFEPIALIATTPVWVVVRKSLLVRTLPELISWMRENPGKASASSVGPAGLGAVVAHYFQKGTGTQLQIISYRGGAPATQDLVAERIDVAFDQAANSLAQVRSGNARALAVFGPRRWSAAPDVPTADEVGVTDLHISYWHGLWAPRDTPRDIVAKLNAAVVAALADDGVKQRFRDLGQEPPPIYLQTSDALRQHQKAEIDKWWPVIRAAKIKAE